MIPGIFNVESDSSSRLDQTQLQSVSENQKMSQSQECLEPYCVLNFTVTCFFIMFASVVAPVLLSHISEQSDP